MSGGSIDAGQLFAVFQASIQADENIRKQAESHLKELAGTPGFAPSLLQIAMMTASAGEPAEAGAIRQASAVYLKNYVEKHWETYDEKVASLIPEGDKESLRSTIIEAIVAASEPVRVQLLTVHRRMIRSDFPKAWSTPLGQIVPLLQSGDVNRITAGLLSFHAIVDWRSHGNKEVTEAVQGQIFPILLQLGQQFVSHISEPAAQNILKILLKSYFTAIQYKFSAWLLSGEAFMGWSQLALQVIQSPVPEAVKALDKEDASEDGYWKMKKWAFHIHNKIMSRWGNSKLETYANQEAPEFARAYMSSMAIPVLQVYLHQIQASVAGQNPLTDRIFCLLSDFLQDCLRAKKTWEAMKEHAMWLVQGWVFPRLCWTEADAELWEEDPHEFIRTRLDPFDDYYSPAASGINLIVDMMKNRKKDTFLPILSFTNQVLSQSQDPAKTDGGLYLVGSLSSQLLASKKVSGQMESFMSSFVLPALTSPHAHLRLRACWVVQQFDELEYKEEASATTALSGVLGCLGDAQFPVRVAACTALAGLLDNPVVARALPPYLPRVVETILSLANEIELDSLSYVLEDIVTQYAEDMAPWAAQLCAQLRDTLMRSLDAYDPSVTTEEGDQVGLFDDTDKMMAVLGMLGTITTLIESMDGKVEVLQQIETCLLPLLYTILSRDIMDVYEELFALIDALTYAQKAISPGLWQLFDLIYHQVFLKSGSSYISDMATTLDNYISYGHQHLLANPAQLHQLVDMIQRTMVEEDFVESDWVHGCNLMESLFLNCRGRIDELLPLFLRLTISHLADKQNEDGSTSPGLHAITHRVYHVEVVLDALYYNLQLTLTELERLGATGIFLAHFIDIADKLVRVHDKKLIIVAISAILQSGIPLQDLPSAWQQNWTTIMPIYLDAIHTLPKAMEDRQKLKEAASRGDDDDGPSRFEGVESDADYSEGEDEIVGAESQAAAPTEYNSDFDDYDDSDWEEADELEEEIYLETPLDHIDVPAIVATAVKACAAAQPAAFQHLTTGLNASQQAILHSILQ